MSKKLILYSAWHYPFAQRTWATLEYLGIPYFYRVLKACKCSSKADQAKEIMLTGLQIFAQAMASKGPYFTRSTCEFFDFASAPFALRIQLLLKHYSGFTMPTYGETWARYATWWIAMKAHPAFLNTKPEPETYFERLTEFYLPDSQGGGQEGVTKFI